MKILAIRLKNLASIEGPFEVDFTKEPLLSAGIFAISGPTGAGKSTILDALCLALYDKTPRFAATGENLYLKDVGDNRINQSDVRNILRRGAGEGFAEVLFLGVDGHRYQSRWTVRRSRYKPDGSLQAQSIQVCDIDTQEEVQGTKTEILNRLVALVGLTYDQFTRTVLLAQNEFATFLKSRESAKAELLEKLTGTEIYSQISKQIYLLTKAANEALNQLKGSVELIKIVPEEELLLLKENKTTLQTKRAELSKLLDSLLEKQKIILSLNTQQEVLNRKLGEERTGKEGLEKCKLSLSEQTEQFNLFKLKCQKLQPDLLKARELDVRIREAESNCEQAKQSAKGVQFKGTELSLQPDGLREQQETNEERGRKLNTFGIQALGEEQTAMLQKQKELQEAKQLVTEWINLRKESETLGKEIAEQQEKLTHGNKELLELERQLTIRQTEAKTLQKVYDSLRIAVGKDVKALREALIAEEACPVCGSVTHPYAHESGAVESHYRQVEKEHKEASQALQELNNRFIALQRDMKHQQGEMEQKQRRLNNTLIEIERKQPPKEEERDLRYFDEKLEALQKQQNLLSTRLKEYQQLYEEWVWYNYKIKEALLLSLQNERRLLLNGMSVEAAEASVQKEEKRQNDALEALRKKVEETQRSISTIQGEVKQLTEVVGKLKAEYEQIEAPENLLETIENSRKQKEEAETQLSAIEVRLLQQEESRKQLKRIGAELKEKESVAAKWEKLNKLIGSADGTKFKVIAQSYTLNLLLMHANKHLSYLSTRYRLQQVPDSLALQVVDCDMCNEVRTVYSLSGGESFLISLALALGLSSLSGNSLKVESLFIDEGFGSLDADSLRMAMEALEQLQLQGRKIGVISHVQEMSERIPVQIQVNKTMNGKSDIAIVG